MTEVSVAATRTVLLPYGRRPYPITVGPNALVCDLPAAPPPIALADALVGALDHPIGCPPLEERVRPGDRVLVIVSDGSRNDPRRAYLEAIADRLPTGCRPTLAIANGTHAPGAVEHLDLGPLGDQWPIVNHDGRGPDIASVGRSRRGTPFRLNRCVVESDLVIATGQIKPHYFAGFGAGVKSIFPGLGENAAIRVNHELKREPEARAGRVVDNPCRDDLEEVLGHLPPAFLLNTIHDAAHHCQGAFAGDVVRAFRAGADACRDLYRVTCTAMPTVIVSDELPLTGSLYQASKLAAAGAPWAVQKLVIVAECPDGTGPADVVQRGIFEPGIRPRLREPAPQIWLVSGLEPNQLASSYCQPAARIEDIPGLDLDNALVMPRAGVSLAG